MERKRGQRNIHRHQRCRIFRRARWFLGFLAMYLCISSRLAALAHPGSRSLVRVAHACLQPSTTKKIKKNHSPSCYPRTNYPGSTSKNLSRAHNPGTAVVHTNLFSGRSLDPFAAADKTTPAAVRKQNTSVRKTRGNNHRQLQPSARARVVREVRAAQERRGDGGGRGLLPLPRLQAAA